MKARVETSVDIVMKTLKVVAFAAVVSLFMGIIFPGKNVIITGAVLGNRT